MPEVQSLKKLSDELHTATVVGDQNSMSDIKSQIESIQKENTKKEKPRSVAANELLNDEDASPIAIFDFLNQSLGKDWPEWEFETIERMLFVDYAFAFEDVNRDRVYALKVIATTDLPFEEWFVFNQCATSLNGHGADFVTLKRPSPGMVLAAISTMKHIRPEMELGFEPGRFACLVLQDSGIYTPPPSHFEELRDDMERLVLPSVRVIWPEVMRTYSSYLNDEIKEFPETEAGIQAMRLMNAESAHEEFLR